MIDSISFQTKARTIDHLGREQIADAPTAISELWKNSFDAYARKAELHIFDGSSPIAVLIDDGHGMDHSEFINRWLVVGTESKATSSLTPVDDRLGLPMRPRLGQKGIGRLSCANLGPILCLVSKRKNSKFIAALVDWRLFENPFLNLSDIQIPVGEFSDKKELFPLIGEMVSELKQNVIGGSDSARSERCRAAWSAFDSLHAEEVSSGEAHRDLPPSEQILSEHSSDMFSSKHLEVWPVWEGSSDHGTALLVGQINYDLRAQLNTSDNDAAAKQSRDRFFETLSSFVDPFVDPSGTELFQQVPEFTYAVRAWSDGRSRLVLGTGKEFDRSTIDQIEHQLVGRIDEQGVFKGRVKAFGEWIDGDCKIEPPKDLEIPNRANTRTGPIEIFFSSVELEPKNTVHTPQEFQRFRELAERYAGLLLFRDGLRVLPFGRSDSDFFEVDLRRSKHAGREFWNHRNMFGRVAISRAGNPNLKDKAGREGLLDNRAAKTLKALVENILQISARRYFGAASELRKEFLPEIQSSNKKKKADEDRAKKRTSDRRKFKTRLDQLSKELPSFHDDVVSYVSDLHIENENQLAAAQERRDDLKEKLVEFRLPGAPEKLGSLEEKFQTFRHQAHEVQACLTLLDATIQSSIDKIKPSSPKELLEKQLARNAAQIHRRIRAWKSEIEALQRTEYQRIRELIDVRNKIFHAEAAPIIHRVDANEIGLAAASELMELLRQKIDAENAEMFIPYIGALESLRDSIDLEHLANFGMEELSEMRSELERLNSLAQLGIAVEINGHELQSYDEIIGTALKKLPDDVIKSKAGQDIVFGFEGLTDQLRFLSPLRLAGQRIQKWIGGNEIFEYVQGFFGVALARHNIEFVATPKFLQSRVYEYPSRLLPVFINLVNNSLYWLSVSEIKNRQIVLDILEGEVVVSDNGPGVSLEDEESLFSLFFTKKVRGGRGVGLYLSKANLSAGGHRIRYERPDKSMPLSGANFVITFRGIELNGS